jgi:hypothetical protein
MCKKTRAWIFSMGSGLGEASQSGLCNENQSGSGRLTSRLHVGKNKLGQRATCKEKKKGAG